MAVATRAHSRAISAPFLKTLVRRVRGAIIAMLIALTLTLAAEPAAAFSQVVIFGDSLSDTGNVFDATFNTIPNPAFYSNGRFSNGPVWVEQLAINLGLSANPSLLGGTNQAYGGATTGTGLLPPPLTTQATNYIGGGTVDSNALYVVFGGGNDVRGATMVSQMEQSVDNIESVITDLATAGAQDFLVANLPDVGKTPEAILDMNTTQKTDLSVAFNNDLASTLPSLASSLGINIFDLGVFAFLNSVLADAGSFGITNTNAACYDGDVTVCPNPDEYVFYDNVHPTTKIHMALGDLATTVIPLPGTVWLLVSALGALGWTRRKRCRSK